MNAKVKLNSNSTYIFKSDDEDKRIVFDRMDYKEKHKSDPPRKKNSMSSPIDPPVYTGRKFEHLKAPDMRESSVPTLHSDTLKYTGPSQKEEVMLAIMDAHLNEMKKEEQVLPDLRKAWLDSATDILTGAPNHLPPLREVNHKIPLIDEDKRYNYHLLRCPEALKTQLIDKIQKYKDAGWWEERNVSQAAPMMCVYKKDGAKLRTIIDGRKRNDNMEKDITPFPDQEQIRHDVARSKYQSKIDMSNAYEQIRVEPQDVWKTAFATIYGTFVSHTMQQGD
jgi:hypothetical protein